MVALGVVDLELSQERERLCVLDPLTDRLQGERLGERDNGLDNVAAGRVAREVAYELDIDLQIVNRKSLEKGKGAVARTEVIERELASKAVQTSKVARSTIGCA